jgi:hypothetical protein
VAQAIFARQNLHERTEVANARDYTVVNLADLNRCCACFDPTDCNLCRLSIRRSNRYVSFIIYVDRNSSFFLNSPNVLSTRTNQGADLVWLNLGSQESWSKSTGIAARTWDAS